MPHRQKAALPAGAIASAVAGAIANAVVAISIAGAQSLSPAQFFCVMAAVRAAASGATAPSPAALCPHMASRHHRTPHMPCHGHRIQQRHLACGVSRIRRPLPPPAVREDGAQQSSGASPGGVHSANDASPAPEWPVPWDGFKMFQVRNGKDAALREGRPSPDRERALRVRSSATGRVGSDRSYAVAQRLLVVQILLARNTQRLLVTS